ncbi:hypothetical protein ABZP12_01253 [Xanthomonas euvesicatoria]
MRHPCRIRSRDGRRARTSHDGRGAQSQPNNTQRSGVASWFFNRGARKRFEEVSSPCLQPAVAALAFNRAARELPGAVSSPLAGPCGGMDAATEPTRTDSRRVPRAVRAPRTRFTTFQNGYWQVARSIAAPSSAPQRIPGHARSGTDAQRSDLMVRSSASWPFSFCSRRAGTGRSLTTHAINSLSPSTRETLVACSCLPLTVMVSLPTTL